jgi:hypothetical protein
MEPPQAIGNVRFALDPEEGERTATPLPMAEAFWSIVHTR